MKMEYLVMAIVALATAVCAGTTHSPLGENRYRKAGNRADRATAFQRENTAASAARKNVPNPNGVAPMDRWKINSPWDGEHSEYQTFTSFSLWRPPVYQLSRPYFIPIYGSNGRIPMYFAPQPYDQSGYDKPPFIGPGYLPPKEYPPKEYLPPTTEDPLDSTVTVRNRFEFDDDDDRPIWDKGTDNSINNESNKPARRPNNTGGIPLSAQDEDSINAIFQTRTTQPTRKPPKRTRPTATTASPQTQRPEAKSPSGPSNCVWAVVSCCSASTNVYPERCFEQRGCPGPFWGSSPCDTEFAKAAVEAALKYYNP